MTPFFRYTILLLLFAAVAGFSPADKKPLNVLFITVDDLRPELGCYGVPGIISPNLDALAAQGVLFKKAYCQQAVCSPSRTSVLTGLRPDVTKVYDLVKHFRSEVPNVVTLPQHFKNNGYKAVSVGKVFHVDDTVSFSRPPWYPRRMTPHGYVTKENIAMAAANNGNGPITEIADVPDSLYADGQIANEAIRFLQTEKEGPFFLAVGFIRPHLPFMAPRKYWELYDRHKMQPSPIRDIPLNAPGYAVNRLSEMRMYTDVPRKGPLDSATAQRAVHGYYASTTYVDAQIGRVLDALKKEGLSDNTIIVLWGDHGFKLGEYSDWVKHTNFEVDVRAPLLIAAPGLKGGTTTEALVEFLDIYPTVCQLAGLPMPAHVQGKSLVPLMKKPTKTLHKAVYNQYPREWMNAMGYSVRTKDYRLTVWYRLKGERPDSLLATELYDHRFNDKETINIADKPGNKKIVDRHFQWLQKGFPIINHKSLTP